MHYNIWEKNIEMNRNWTSFYFPFAIPPLLFVIQGFFETLIRPIMQLLHGLRDLMETFKCKESTIWDINKLKLRYQLIVANNDFIKLKFKITYQVFLSETKQIRGSVDDPCVCPTDELAAPPLSTVGYSCEMVGWSVGGKWWSRGRHGGWSLCGCA